MIYRLFIAAALAALAAPPSQAELLPGEVFGPRPEIAARRGPHIFNSVYDSLRKWGAIVHPNGMSLYLATVPQGAMFYHGNNRNATPTELDWLAYDIEHAEMFARARRPGRPPSPPPPKNTDQPTELKRDHGEQLPLADLESKPAEGQHGWLHTYRTTRPLRFLYIDGMSGNKGNSGVIDTQDYLLRGVRDTRDKQMQKPTNADRALGPPGEQDRAKELCSMCEDWGLQGVIRTESPGFEIIKCDFFDGLEQIQSLQRSDEKSGRLRHGRPGRPGGLPPDSPGGPPPDGPGGPPPDGPGGPPPGGPGGPGFRRDPEDRHREVSSARTILDYSSMVSAFFFPLNLTNPDRENSKYPRLTGTTKEEMAAVKAYLSRIIKERYDAPVSPINWRDIADLVVRRYGDSIRKMANDIDSVEDMASHIQFLLEVYIDYSVDDKMYRDVAAQERCASFYIQTMPLNTQIDRLIHAAFKAVNAEICRTLFRVRACVIDDTSADQKKIDEIKAEMKSLVEYLDWNVFE